MSNNNQTFKIISEHFLESDWQASQLGEQPILNLHYKGRFEGARIEEWKCQVIAKENQHFKTVVFLSFVPLIIQKNQIKLIAELLHRINYLENIGDFEINYDTGQIRCKTSVQVSNIDISSDLICNLEGNNTDLVGKYLPAIRQVNQGELMPFDVIDEDDFNYY